MNREELKEKICEISNSEFPLIDFFNDIALNNNKNFDKERAYEDIEKIYEVFVYYINKCKQLEKELKQTKSNFKNSQTHSKNCYKKLKEKYTRLERAYKNNEVMTRDLNELINRNLELRKQIENLEEENQELKEKNLKISIENHNSKIVEEMNKTVVENKNKQLLEATELNITYLDKIIMLKKAIKILMRFKFELHETNRNRTGLEVYTASLLEREQLEKEEYELLKQVFESAGGE